MKEKHNRYSAHLVACYGARINKNQTVHQTLWVIMIDAQANVNYRIAAAQVWCESVNCGGSTHTYAEAATMLNDLSEVADKQGAHALADVAFDLGDLMKEYADDAREWAACGYNPNVYYGVGE